MLFVGHDSVPVTPHEDGKENEEPPMSARSTVSRYDSSTVID